MRDYSYWKSYVASKRELRRWRGVRAKGIAIRKKTNTAVKHKVGRVWKYITSCIRGGPTTQKYYASDII